MNYDFKPKSCANCVHLDQEEGSVGGLRIGGCRERLTRFLVKEEYFKNNYCGQWYLKQLTDKDY